MYISILVFIASHCGFLVFLCFAPDDDRIAIETRSVEYTIRIDY
jgi:hypothetical protein